MCQMKKLSLSETKKQALISALDSQASHMDKFMRKIYDDTIAQVKTAQDKLMLTEAQVSICKSALSSIPSTNSDAQSMFDQLTMTRKEYAALHE